ncbi:hypothetical protein ACSNN7_00860 [Micromonospora sp. URMC 105]|uniref:hypothetical protein n=1 Tax=Micromonospora sp. URMC 105 TaxID=3423413 RepID=UPI003F1C0871
MAEYVASHGSRTREGNPLRAELVINDQVDGAGRLAVYVNDQLVLETVTSHLNTGEVEVVTTVGTQRPDVSDSEIRLTLTVDDPVTVSGVVGSSELAEADLNYVADHDQMLRALSGEPRGVDASLLRVLDFRSIAAGLEEDAVRRFAVDASSSKGRCVGCRARCTAAYATCGIPCAAIPPPLNAACLAACSALYADCYWNKCKRACK